METEMRKSRHGPPVTCRAPLFALMAAGTLLAGCENLPLVQQVHQACANVPEPQKQSCEDAEYQRLYEIEKQRNRRIAYP